MPPQPQAGGVLSAAEVCAAFALTYGAVHDFHPAFDQLFSDGTADGAWTNLVAEALRRLAGDGGCQPLRASAVHTALAQLLSQLGDPATRMLPLEEQSPQVIGKSAATDAPIQRVVTAHAQIGGLVEVALNVSTASASEVEQALRPVLEQHAGAELILDLAAANHWWEQAEPLPDWRTPSSWETVGAQSRLAAIGEVLLKLFGTGTGTRVTTATRQHIGLQHTAVDPIIHADVRPLVGRYQSGLFVRSRRPVPTADVAFTGALTVLVPAGLAPWLEPALLELKARPSTTVSLADGSGWAAYGHIVPLPGDLCLEVRRWALMSDHRQVAPAASPVVTTDRGLVQIAALLALHHVMRTYNPYFVPAHKDADWAEALSGAVREVLTAGERGLPDQQFASLLWDCAAEIPGGHTRTWGPDRSRPIPFLPGNMAPPVLLEITAGNEVVVGSAPGECGLLPGDRVIAVDGVSVEALLLAYIHHLRVYTPSAARLHAVRWLLAGPAESRVVVTVQRCGSSGDVEIAAELDRSQHIWQLIASHAFPGDDAVRLIRRDGVAVGYIDLGRVGADDFEQALNRISDAAALLLDMRGYPRGGAPDLSRFFPVGSAYSFVARRPVLASPVGWQERRSGWLEDRYELVDPQHTGGDARPLAVLCFGATASEAEGIVDQLKATGRAVLVGTRTKGACGAPTWTSLPGGYHVQFSGAATSREGSPSFEAEGLAPDVECWPTRAGLAERRDEVLEQAVRTLVERLSE